MKIANDLLLKILGILLLTAAAMKGYQLLTEPVANVDIWSNHNFLIVIVEFELALGIWLLSGLFKKAAWLAALICFSLFSAITLYKGLSGADSCGCFGSVQINPWITLFAVDIPAVIALLVFRSKEEKLIYWPSIPKFTATALVGLIVVGITTPVLALNKPSKITSEYEVLEPSNWIGKKLPILEHINIGKQLRKGNWLVLLYHHDCPDCIKAISTYEQIARDLAGNEDFLRIALIETPPYRKRVTNINSFCVIGRLADVKEWFITTPAVALLVNGKVTSTWEEEAPDLNTILEKIASTKLSTSSL